MKLRNLHVYFLLALFFVLSNSFLLPLAKAADGYVDGYVKDTDGNPVTGLYVDACVAPCSNSDWISSAQTTIDGYYKITLPAGTYKIRYYTFGDYAQYAANWYHNQPDYAHADDVEVQDGATKTLEETTLKSGGSISGTVTNGNVGVSNISVYIYSSGIWTGRSATTGSTGKYKVSGLETGDYTVKFSGVNAGFITEWYNDKENQGDANNVHVESPDETPSINAILAYGEKISGKTTISETGAPLVGAWVAVCDNTTTATCNSSNPARKGYAQTGADGSYTVGGLPSGTYKVQFFEKTANNAGAGITKWYNDRFDAATADSVSVGQTDVDAVFNGASISGTVTDSAGEKIAGVIVKAYDSSGSLAATSPATGTDGEYTVVGLQRDSYTLYFQADGTGYSSEWYNNQTEEKSADAVDITSLGDALTGKDAELDLGVSISGSVTIKAGDSDPVPLEGGLVAVYDSADSSLLRGTATTGADGIYEVTGLPAGGTFKVRFFRKTTANGSGYGTSEWYDDQPNFDQATEVQAGDTTVDAVLEPSSLIPIYKLLLKSRPQPENP